MIRCGVECREVGRRSFERNSPPASLTLKFRRTPTVFGVSECMYKFLAVVRMYLELWVEFWALKMDSGINPASLSVAGVKLQLGTSAFENDEAEVLWFQSLHFSP